MLILSRYRGESIYIGNNVKVTVTDVNGGRVRLGIEAPREMEVDREEIRVRKEAQKKVKGARNDQQDT